MDQRPKIASKSRAWCIAVGLALASVGLQSPQSANAAPGNFTAPFNSGESWVIYQGYGSGTHSGGYALDRAP